VEDEMTARQTEVETRFAEPNVEEREIAFKAADGFPLTGRLIIGRGDLPLVLISSATAVPMGFYLAFARRLVAAGVRGALIYDYRGTGASPRPAGWRSRINMKDWALLDFPAAAEALGSVAPGHAMVGIGQSFGGQALGLSGIAARFERYAMVATMSGARRLIDDPWVWPRMNLIGLPVSLLFGEIPRWIGIGEPLPGSVFRDWARWCRSRHYFFDDPRLPETKNFEGVRIPLLSLGMEDDPWGTDRAIGHFLARHPNAQISSRTLTVAESGADAIGHLGFFRSRFSQTLWPQVIDWLLEGKSVNLGRPCPSC
jgi:predicted alpha/beta hydrolase